MKSARLSICAVLVLAFGCGESTTSGTASSGKCGRSIQDMVDAAAPGATVTVPACDYTNPNSAIAAVRITKPLTLKASGKVRILPGPGQKHGILVEPEHDGDPDIDGIDINGFTVEGFENMGIWLRHVNHFTVENNESIDNLENGIFPTLSANGLVKKNVSYGSQDAALWVEGSENVRVMDNDIHNSPTGIEVTISKEITLEQNKIHNNTIGIGLYHPSTAGLPSSEWPSQPFGSWHVLNNQVYENNEQNTASEGSETSQLPYGGGILLLGVDHVDVQQNQVENNDFFGVAMIDYCLATNGTEFDCRVVKPEVRDTSPDNNQILSNTLIKNGTAPPDGPFAYAAADLIVLSGKNNCASGNTTDTEVVVADLPECPAGSSL